MKLVFGEERFLVKREISRFKKAAKENGLEVLVSDSCSQDVINMASGGFMDYAVLIQLDGIDQIPQLFLKDTVNPVMAVLQKTPTETQLKKLQEGIEPVRFDRLTPEEAFMLQGFPLDFVKRAREKNVSDGALYSQSGNAVSVNTIYALLHFLIDNKLMRNTREREQNM